MADKYLNLSGLDYYDQKRKLYIDNSLNKKVDKLNNRFWGSADFFPYQSGGNARYDMAGWFESSNGNGTVSIQDLSDPPVTGLRKKAVIVDNTSGNKDVAFKMFGVARNKPFTLSGWFRKNSSAESVTAQVRIWDYTRNAVGATFRTTLSSTTWQRFEHTYTASSEQYANNMYGAIFGVAGAGGIEYCGLKLEYGSSATPWCESTYDYTNILQDEIVADERTGAGADLVCTIRSEIYDGKRILYPLDYAAASNVTLTVSLPDMTTNAQPVYVSGTTRLGTQYGAGSLIPLTWVTKRSGWVVDGDANTQDKIEAYNIRSANQLYYKSAVTANSLVGSVGDGLFALTAGSTFDISYRLYWQSSAIAAGATNNMSWLNHSTINLTNLKSGFSGTTNQTVYLIGTLDGTMFTIDDDIITDTPPTTADGKVYIPLGILYTTTNIFFISPSASEMFHYKDGKFRLYSE